MESTSSSLTPQGSEEFAAIGAAEVEIISCRRRTGGTISALIRDTHGSEEWLLRVKPAALQSFRSFQSACAESLGLWCRHYVEGLRPAAAKRDWNDEIEAAFVAGAKPAPQKAGAA